METKTCIHCGCQKPINEFPAKRNCCKQCNNKYHRKWRIEHREQVNENRRRYLAEHPSKISDKRKEYLKSYRSNHKSYYAQKVGEYEKTPKGRIAKANKDHNRRAQKKGGKITLTEWTTIKQQQGFRCYWCREKFPDNKLEMDHVISLRRGGLHDVSNIVASCKLCNCKKRAAVWSLV